MGSSAAVTRDEKKNAARAVRRSVIEVVPRNDVPCAVRNLGYSPDRIHRTVFTGPWPFGDALDGSI